MAIKPFNSLGGFTVGQNLVPSIDANNNATFNDLVANGNVAFNSADFNLSGNATIAGTLSVAGAVSMSDTLTVASTSNLNYVNVASDLAVGQALSVTGAANLNSTLGVTGAATLSSTLDVTGDTHIVGQITVDGYGVFNDGAEVNGSLEVTNDLTVSGQTTLDSTLAVTGQTELGGTLYVNGASTLDNTLTVTGDATLSSNLTVAGQTNLGQIANVHVLGGNAGQVLKTDGLGNLYWDQIDPMAQGDTSIDIDNVTGYINLTVNGVANVVQVTENGLTLTGTQSVTGAADFGSSVSVTGDTTVGGDLSTTGSISTSSNLSVTGTANVGSTLGVTGATTLSDTLAVSGATTLGDTLAVTGAANLSSTLGVAGAATLDSTLSVASDATVGGGLSVTGNISTSSALNVSGSANVGTTLGVASDLTVGGATFLQGSLDVSGLASFNSDVSIDADLSAIGISASTGSFSVSLNSVNLTATGTVDLGDLANVHVAGGSSGQVLKTDGAGNLTWETNAILVNGTSNVDIPVADGNVNISVGGVANIVTVGTATTIVNNDLQVIGNLIISGTQTDVNVTNLNVQDPVITEGRDANNAPLTLNDGLDRGLHAYYYDGDASQEKGAFIGFKNPSAASADAGKFVIASDASLSDNVATVNSYADVVVNSVQSGIDGGASRVVLGENQVTIVANDNTVVQVDPWGVQITGTNRFYGELRNNDLDETTGAQITTFATTQVAIATIADNRPGAVLEVTLRGIDVVSGKMEVNKFMVLTNAAGQVDYTGSSTLRLVGTPGAVDFITTATGVSSGDLSIVVTPASTNQTNWVATYTRML